MPAATPKLNNMFMSASAECCSTHASITAAFVGWVEAKRVLSSRVLPKPIIHPRGLDGFRYSEFAARVYVVDRSTHPTAARAIADSVGWVERHKRVYALLDALWCVLHALSRNPSLKPHDLI